MNWKEWYAEVERMKTEHCCSPEEDDEVCFFSACAREELEAIISCPGSSEAEREECRELIILVDTGSIAL
jgi:hypothetical protein